MDRVKTVRPKMIRSNYVQTQTSVIFSNIHNILCDFFYPFKTEDRIILGRTVLILKTGNIPSTWSWLNAVIRFECENSAIDVIINFS
jgi:hypothetical protein